jgi:hypothetical protein
MPNTLLRYPLDPTGVNPDNYVNAEPHTLESLRIRSIAPTYGGYFTESLRVFDSVTNNILVRGVQYYCSELLQHETEIYAKEICNVIVITDPTVSSTVRIDYQALGGPYTRSADAIINLYNLFLNDNRPVSWPNIINKPDAFAPGPHLHDIGDVYGFEYLVGAMERIRNAILLADVPGYEKVLNYITNEIKSIRQTFSAQINQLSALSDISQLPVATALSNGTMSAADKVALDAIRKASTNSVKQYILPAGYNIAYKNTLSFVAEVKGIIFVVSTLQLAYPNRNAFSHQLIFNGVTQTGDQTRLPTTQFSNKTIQAGESMTIEQTVTTLVAESPDGIQPISFGFIYMFIPTP